MAESTLSVAYADVQNALGRYLGFGDPAAFGSIATYGTAGYTIEQYVKQGTRWFVFPPPLPGQPLAHSWSFLKPTAPIAVTSAPYSSTATITVTIVNGVVTLAVGTWPSWAASGVLTIGSRSYSVNTRDSGSQLTLDDLTVDADAGSSFVLDQRDYDLSEAFGFLEDDLTYDPGLSGTAIRLVGESEIRKLRQGLGSGTGKPLLAAIRYKTKTVSASIGQRQEIMFYPAPDAAYTFTGKFQTLPDKISASDIYAWGGMAHSETLKAACLAAAEVGENDQSGLHFNEFLKQLAKSIAFDLRTRPHYLGRNTDRSDDLRDGVGHRHRSGEGPVQYTDANGVSYPG